MANLFDRFVAQYSDALSGAQTISERSAMQDLINVAKEGNTFQEFVNSGTNSLSDIIEALSKYGSYKQYQAEQIKLATADSLNSCLAGPDLTSEIAVRLQNASIGQLIDEWKSSGFITKTEDLAEKSNTDLATQLDALKCSHPYVRNLANAPLSEATGFLAENTNNFVITSRLVFEGDDLPQMDGYTVHLEKKTGDTYTAMGNVISDPEGNFMIPFDKVTDDDTLPPTDEEFRVTVYANYDDTDPLNTPELILVDSFSDPVIDGGTLTIPYTPPPQPYTPPSSDLEADEIIAPDSAGYITELDPSITSLRDIRQSGGIMTLYKTAETPPSGITDANIADFQRADSYADLDFMAEGIYNPAAPGPGEANKRLELSTGLIDKGYNGISDIAKQSKDQFVADVTSIPGLGITTDMGTAMYDKAATAARMASSVSIGMISHQQTDQSQSESQAVLSVNVDRGCECSDCETAVSPLAYLAALLDFTTRNLKQPGAVTIQNLTTTFHQPFGDLPAECDEVDRLVCQQRLAIEVLRSYMGEDIPASINAYLQQAYFAFLEKNGTSYQEIRLLGAATSPENIASLADRLGVNNDFASVSYLKTDPATLTEAWLEQIFNLQDTSRDRLSDGVKIFTDPDHEQVTRWNLHGVEWNKNTDENGLILVEVIYEGTTVVVNLYKDQYKDVAVGTGVLSKPSGGAISGVVKVDAIGSSGLKGEFTVSNITTSLTDFSISTTGRLLSEKLQKLYQTWQEEDAQQSNPYISHTIPVIDPDLIGIENLRFYTAFNDVGKPAGLLWTRRRAAIDTWYGQLNMNGASARPHKGTNSMYTLMTTTTTAFTYAYQGISPITINPSGHEFWKLSGFDLEAAYNNIIAGTITTTLVNDLKSKMYLSVDAFRRFYELYLKASLTTEERYDYLNILVSSIKERAADGAVLTSNRTWMSEEVLLNIRMGNSAFIPDSEEASIGQTPAPRSSIVVKNTNNSATPGLVTVTINVPFIDPELLPEAQMINPLYAAAPHTKWASRKTQLASTNSTLLNLAKTSTFINLLDNVYDVTDFSPAYRITNSLTLVQLFTSVTSDLNSPDSAAVSKAEGEIQNLLLSVSDYKLLMDVKFKKDNSLAVSESEYNSVAAILTSAKKIKSFYNVTGGGASGNWYSDESSINYWEILKQRLPAWRANPVQKQLWLEALEASNSNPAIDPDVITDTDMRLPKTGSVVNNIFLARLDEMNSLRLSIHETAIEPENNVDFEAKVEFIASMINYYADITRPEFESLREKYNNGESVGTRLKQMNIPYGDFEYWCALFTLGGSDGDMYPEWKNFARSIANIYKIKQFAAWKKEEQTYNIVVNPLLFEKNPDERPLDPTVPGDWQERYNALYSKWRQILLERNTTQQSLITDYNDIIHEVEEDCLNNLRDLLLAHIAIGPSENPEELSPVAFNAKKYTGKLLIDMENNCCQRTTRVAQAMDTIQSLLWQTRSGQILTAYPLSGTPRFSIDTEIFDNEWQWLGSYETWRSYMFVYLYPENLLLPTIRTWQSPAFMEFVSTLRSRSILNEKDAAFAASKFYDYVKEVASITVQASCRGNTTIYEKDAYGREFSYVKELIYLFGKSAANKMYFCTYDPEDKTGYAQSDWRELPFSEEALIRVHAARLYDFWYRPTIHVFFSVWTKNDGAKLSTLKIELTENNSLHETFGFEINADGLLPKDDEGWLIDHNSIVVSEGEFIENGNTGQNRFVAVAWLKKQGITNILFTRFMKPVTLDDWDNVFPLFAQTVDATSFRFTELFYLKEYQETGPVASGLFKSYLVVGNSTNTNSSGGSIVFADILIYREFWNHPDPRYDETGSSTAITKGAFRSPVWPFAGAPIPQHSSLEGIFYDPAARKVKVCYTAPAIGPFPPGTIVISLPSIINLEFDASGVYTGQSAEIGVYGLSRIISVIRDSKQRYFMQYEVGSFNSGKGTFISRYAPSTGSIGSTMRTVPLINKVNYFLGKKTRVELAALKAEQQTVFTQNPIGRNATNNTPTGNFRINNLLEEAYYFVPVYVADRLQKSGDYLAALDWYQTVYDYTQPRANRKIHYGLIREETLNLFKADSWGHDPSNPHNIAATRVNAYTTYTLQNIIRCILDYADSEFTADTAETVSRARTLYLTALNLLEDPLMNPANEGCQTILGLLNLSYPPGDTYKPMDRELRQMLSMVTDSSKLSGLVQEINTIFSGGGSATEHFADARAAVWEVLETNDGVPTVTVRLDQKAQSERIAVQAAMASGTYTSAISSESMNTSAKLQYVPSLNFNFCVSPNPVADGLRLKANLNLFKIRNCRNIAGMIRELEPYAAPTDAYSGMPTIGENGIINRSSRRPLKSSDYRFKVVIARAKELAEMANRLENTLLSLYEKADAENYNILKAKQDISTAKEGVKLQDLRYKEAEDNVQLATLEKELAQIQQSTYSSWISSGINEFEQRMLTLYSEISVWQSILGYTNAAGQSLSALSSAAGSTVFSESVKSGLAVAAGAVYFAAAGLENRINVLNERIQTSSFWATYLRRAQEWTLQLALANKSVQIGDQKIKIANDQVRVVGQEKKIAEMQTDHAQQGLDFLKTKFTNADLYEWMSGVIAKTYAFFLDQATAVARLAVDQLYFERQSYDAPALLANYYDAPIENVLPGSNTSAPDRRGLTGSYRLLQDISAIEQYAFDTDKRKLQMSKTISLAKLKAIEFQDFKKTGEITFATLLSDFDNDFPGQYLRLIKRVKVSVIALVPPVEGIKATLTCVGNSNVVIKNEEKFEISRISRATESVSLTGANNAMGLFEMETQPNEFFYPFEGIGVETLWSFVLPRATNKFDYTTIADILVTIEYTALEDYNYRSEVAKRLNEQASSPEGEVSFSLRNNFADQWYDLYNSAVNNGSMAVAFNTFRYDFPVNIYNLAMSEYKLYFLTEPVQPDEGGPQQDFNGVAVTLGFKQKGRTGGISSQKSCIDNVCKWPVSGSNTVPEGEWTLSIPTSEPIRNLFKEDKVKDIILIVSLKGKNENWPSSYVFSK